jgi:hypothetical protein
MIADMLEALPLPPRAHSTWQFRKLLSSFTPDFRISDFPSPKMTISDTLPDCP